MKQFIIIFLYLVLVESWDLNSFGISDNYYISSVAIHRPKTFLALSRSVCHNNITNPTLIEVPWKGDYIYSVPTILNIRNKLLEYQEWGECDHIQDAVSLSFEPKKPKLWILDKGGDFCPPKILSYNSLYNSLQESRELSGIPQEKLNVLTIDPESGEYGYRAYIGNVGSNMLLVFSLKELKWWTIELISNTVVPVMADFLALSKTEAILYITGRNSVEIFSVDLENLRNSDGPIASDTDTQKIFMQTNATLQGSKLGISSGLESDYKSGLNYYMVRDYVILRWITGYPLEAEYHNVLAQSYEKLPYVTHLFTGPQSGLWALVNPLSPEECFEMNNTVKAGDIPKPANRVVKILKYNKFFDELS